MTSFKNIFRKCVCVLSCFSHVQLLVTLWSGACQVPLSMGFPRKEYWSRLPIFPPRDLPNPVMVKYICVKYSIYCFSIRVGRKGRICAKTMKVQSALIFSHNNQVKGSQTGYQHQIFLHGERGSAMCTKVTNLSNELRDMPSNLNPHLL